MREIVLDTESTGLNPHGGDRIVEIGCVELSGRVQTGRTYHVHINPMRPMPLAAEQIHGLTDDFLADKPPFEDVVDSFLEFIGDDTLVIHNAAFDMGFLNAELARLDLPPLAAGRATDTLAIAKRRFPGAQASLDALCRRYGVDNSARTTHGALLDSQLLAEVYLELSGGRQPGLGLVANAASGAAAAGAGAKRRLAPRPHEASPAERASHAAFLEKMRNPLWRT